MYLTDDENLAAERLDDAIAWCSAPESGPELRRLLKTLRRWRNEILAHHHTGASKGPVEAANLLIKQLKRSGQGMGPQEATVRDDTNSVWDAQAGGLLSWVCRLPMTTGLRLGTRPVAREVSMPVKARIYEPDSLLSGLSLSNEHGVDVESQAAFKLNESNEFKQRGYQGRLGPGKPKGAFLRRLPFVSVRCCRIFGPEQRHLSPTSDLQVTSVGHLTPVRRVWLPKLRAAGVRGHLSNPEGRFGSESDSSDASSASLVVCRCRTKAGMGWLVGLCL